MRVTRKWTSKEEDLLRKLVRDNPYICTGEIAQRLGRAISSVHHKLSRLQIPLIQNKPKFWNSKRVGKLKKLAANPLMRGKDIAGKLEVTETAVRSKLSKLKIRNAPEYEWTQEEISLVVEMAADLQYRRKDIARVLGIPLRRVNSLLYSRLKIGNKYDTKNHVEMTPELLDILDGHMLGDGAYQNKRPEHRGATFRVASIHENYARGLSALLTKHGVMSGVVPVYDSRYTSGVAWLMFTRKYVEFGDQWDRWYPPEYRRECKQYGLKIYKRCPMDINLNGRKLLYWYMGDGSYSKETSGAKLMRLCSRDFNRREWEILASQICELGIECTLYETRRKNGKLVYDMFIPFDSRHQFLNVIGDYPPWASDLSYKWDHRNIPMEFFTVRDLATFFEVSTGTIAHWKKKAGMLRRKTTDKFSSNTVSRLIQWLVRSGYRPSSIDPRQFNTSVVRYALSIWAATKPWFPTQKVTHGNRKITIQMGNESIDAQINIEDLRKQQ